MTNGKLLQGVVVCGALSLLARAASANTITIGDFVLKNTFRDLGNGINVVEGEQEEETAPRVATGRRPQRYKAAQPKAPRRGQTVWEQSGPEPTSPSTSRSSA